MRRRVITTAPGEPAGWFGLESAIDELAFELGMDPIEVRVRNVPVDLDVPEIDVTSIDQPDRHTPIGARGVGEISITGVGGGGRQRRAQRDRTTHSGFADHAR